MENAENHEVKFTLTYDGEALRHHRIDARELAESLLGLADAVQEANRMMNGGEVKAVFEVEGEVHANCVTIPAVIATYGPAVAGVAAALEFIQHEDAKALLKTLVGLINFFKKKEGRKIIRVEASGEGNVAVHVEGDNNTVIIAPKEVYAASENPRIRVAYQKMSKPLKKEGVETLRLEAKTGEDIHAEITKDDVLDRNVFPDPVIDDTETLVTEHVEALRVIKPHLDGNGDQRWTFHNGDRQVTMTVEDYGFLAKVARHEYNFSGAQRIVARVRRFQDRQTLRTVAQTVVEVVDYQTPDSDKQTDFGFAVPERPRRLIVDDVKPLPAAPKKPRKR